MSKLEMSKFWDCGYREKWDTDKEKAARRIFLTRMTKHNKYMQVEAYRNPVAGSN